MVYCWYNSNGDERSKVSGPGTMTNDEGWLRVGELGLGKVVGKPDPAGITFGELGEKFLANYPFNKISTEELHEQVVRTLLMPKWAKRGRYRN